MPDFHIWCYLAASPQASLPGVAALKLETTAMPKSPFAYSHKWSFLSGNIYLSVTLTVLV